MAAANIETRHRRGQGNPCRALSGGRCNCSPSYRVRVWSNGEGREIKKTFKTFAEAKTWADDARVAIRQGMMRAPTPITLRQVAAEWLDLARAGKLVSRSKRPYKPSTIRGYERALRLRLLPELGDVRLSDLRRGEVQVFVDTMLADELAPSTILNTLDPLRSIFRWAIKRDLVALDPTDLLELPESLGGRERIASPAEAKRLLAVLPDLERALWATAFYAGLRRGELRALRWCHVDFGATDRQGVIRVERSWDDVEGEIDVKTKAGRRKVPLLGELKRELTEHGLRVSGDGEVVLGSDALVFGDGAAPFQPTTVRRRAIAAWERANAEAIEAAREEGRLLPEQELLRPIGLHEGRHTFASILIAAGANAKAVQVAVGHSSIQTTYDIYGHLMPGNESETAALVDAYLERSVGE